MIPWDHRESAHAVAIVRIVYGLAITAHLGRMWATGAWRWTWQGPDNGGLVGLHPTPIDWIGGPTPGNVEMVMGLGIASGLCFALGCLTPLANLVLAWCWASLCGLCPNAGGSYDYLGGAVLWVLLFSGCGGAWSLDAAIRARRGRPAATAYAVVRWLLCWQLVVMYDSTVWHKLSSGWVPWGSLDVLWYVLQQPTWHRFEMSWLAPLYPLTQLGTLTTWCFEHSSPLLVLAAWFRHTRARPGWLRAQFNRVDFRAAFLAFGLLLHTLIEATLEVGSFSLFTLGLYAACFSGDEVRRALTRPPPA